MTALAVAVVAFVAMEPAVALVHRTVMHGRRGWLWHVSHHRGGAPGPQGGHATRRRFERNDLYPVVFAAITVSAMAAGAAVAALRPVLWAGFGITAYGAAYLVLHDGFVHGRLGTLPGARSRYVRWVRDAHHVHHATGRAPYGLLVPVRPQPSGAAPVPFEELADAREAASRAWDVTGSPGRAQGGGATS